MEAAALAVPQSVTPSEYTTTDLGGYGLVKGLTMSDNVGGIMAPVTEGFRIRVTGSNVQRRILFYCFSSKVRMMISNGMLIA